MRKLMTISKAVLLTAGIALSSMAAGCGGAESPDDELSRSEDGLMIGGSFGGKQSGFDKCVDDCTDAYLDCQFNNPEGSLERSLCDQQFDRCVAWCDWIYPASYATLAL